MSRLPSIDTERNSVTTIRGTIDVQIETCKGCELCIEACPQDSIDLSNEINKKGYHYAVLVKDNCTGCVNCALVCPDAVITVYRKKKGSARPEPVAVLTQVKRNLAVVIDEIPEGRVSI